MYTELLCARTNDSTVERRDRPREPISPACGGDNLGEEDGQHGPAKRRKIAASYAGYEGDRGHEKQSHCGSDKDITKRLPGKLVRPAWDIDKAADKETNQINPYGCGEDPRRNDEQFCCDNYLA